MYAAFVCILILVNYTRRANGGYVEIVETSGCQSCRLYLTCRHLTAVMAILNVDFVPKLNNESKDVNETSLSHVFPPVHPRDILNRRCSGVNHCSFIFSEDCPGADYYGLGNITIKYACITEDRIWKYCNTDLILPKVYTKGISEGFIHNPGYPRFYPGLKQCRWKITAQPHQKIRLTILDLSLTADKMTTPEDCTDLLEIEDTGQVIHSSCHQQHPPAEIVSGSESIEIALSSKEPLNPHRGFFIHYTVLGCLELPVPHNAYVVYSKPDLVVLNCCLGHHFPDTGTRTKTIKCFGALWNVSLPLLKCEQDKSFPPHQQTKHTIRKQNDKSNMSAELIAPICVIVALFAINGIVVFFIYKAKQKVALDIKDEELGNFTSSPFDT